jgi:signal transduction histidine kinase
MGRRNCGLQAASPLETEDCTEASPAAEAVIAALSHDLRSPLNTIIGFSDILLTGRIGKLNAQQKNQMDIVLNRGQELLGLIDDLVEYARLLRGDVSLHLSAVLLVPFLERQLELLKTYLAEGGPTLVYVPPKTQHRVVADEQKLILVVEQVFRTGMAVANPRVVRIDVQTIPRSERGSSEASIRVRIGFQGRFRIELEDLFEWEHKNEVPGKVRFGLHLARFYVNRMGGNLSLSRKKGRLEFHLNLCKENK